MIGYQTQNVANTAKRIENLTFQRLENERERQSFFGTRPEVESRLRFLQVGLSIVLLVGRLVAAATHSVSVVGGRRRHVSDGGEYAGRNRQDPVSVDARFQVEERFDVLPVFI